MSSEASSGSVNSSNCSESPTSHDCVRQRRKYPL